MKLTIQELCSAIEAFAPPAYQEGWDNSGLLIGDARREISSALITLDVTEAVLDEAIKNGDGLIIAHHPAIFSGLKRLNGRNESERIVMKAIQHNVAIYAAHTNIDVVKNGVSWKMAEKMGLQNVRTLAPQTGLLKKLVTFVPVNDAAAVREAVFAAGAGHIGNYDSCSFNARGEGSFRGNAESQPYAGKKETLHFEEEVRFETIFPAHLQARVLDALLNAHPYEEVAYDVYALDNQHPQVGLGVIGEFEVETAADEALQRLKNAFECRLIKHTDIHQPTFKKVALVGGAGSSLLKQAMRAGADLFVSGDFKYHQFFEAENKITIADIGHFESEQFTKELFYEILTNKFSKFAVRLSEVNTNPVNYLF
ncbi:Nif3-like dinuclear metal center hexameric protein [Roseimarinus sediminis]|uniref:Nif3-like dinuclear metal center hexameric protein n=1 Tax=Roseimarinus sediminis TaxID=1610899 RepID=UPI003D1BCE08